MSNEKSAPAAAPKADQADAANLAEAQGKQVLTTTIVDNTDAEPTPEREPEQKVRKLGHVQIVDYV